MNWFSSFWGWSETQVLDLIVNLKKGVAIVEADIAAANAWIVANSTKISADIEAVLGIVETASAAGIKLPIGVATAAAAANEANNALQAYVAAAQSGQNTATALIAGYTAAKQAAQAHAATAIAVATAPTK